MLYLFEFLIYTFYSPDVDAINGLKTAAQAGLQNIIIAAAALVSSGTISSSSGESFCIQVSLVQVFLAVPEQIWGIVSKTILRKSGPPGEPDFKTTEKEIMLANKKKSVTLKHKLKACGFVLRSIKSMRHVLQEGDLGNIIIEILIRKDLMLSLDMLESGCLCEILALIFVCPGVQDALELEMKQSPQIRPVSELILQNRWETSVDFVEGVLHIFRIQDFLELGLQNTIENATDFTESIISKQSRINDSPTIMYTEFLPTCIANLELFGLDDPDESLPEQITGLLPLQMQKQYIPYNNVILADLVYHTVGSGIVHVFTGNNDRPQNESPKDNEELQFPVITCEELMQAPQATATVNYKHGRRQLQTYFCNDSSGHSAIDCFTEIPSAAPEESSKGALLRRQTISEKTSLALQYDQAVMDTEIEDGQQLFKNFVKTAIGGLIDVCSCANPGEKKLSDGMRRENSRYTFDFFRESQLEDHSGHGNKETDNDITHISQQPEIVYLNEATDLSSMDQKHLFTELQSEKTNPDSQGANSPTGLEFNVCTSPVYIKTISDEGNQDVFKAFITRLVRAADSETMDKLQETLMNKLPEQLTSIFDEAPSALGAAASFYSLGTDNDEEEEDEQGGNEKSEKNATDKRTETSEENGHIRVTEHQDYSQKTAENSSTAVNIAHQESAVNIGCWLAWNSMLFSLFFILVLCTLVFVATLATTSCICPLNATNGTLG